MVADVTMVGQHDATQDHDVTQDHLMAVLSMRLQDVHNGRPDCVGMHYESYNRKYPDPPFRT